LQFCLHHAVREKHPDIIENGLIVRNSATAYAADTVRDVWWDWG